MCNKAEWKKKYLLSFFKFYKFFIIKCAYISKSWFFLKKPKFCIQFFHNLFGQKLHFQVFVFDLNSSRNLAFLYWDWRFAQRNVARYVTVSIPYFTVFLFSVKISWKFLILWMLERKLKSDFITGGAIPFTIFYTSVMRTCKFVWWIVGSFSSLNICWKSLLVSFLYVSLRPLSCTLLIKLFDCLE